MLKRKAEESRSKAPTYMLCCVAITVDPGEMPSLKNLLVTPDAWVTRPDSAGYASHASVRVEGLLCHSL